ncbi:MAG: carbohydrate kinase [Bacteroidetes bacterium]|nr:MAG: carbohydrate kinase [Bacteroidota bacterium]
MYFLGYDIGSSSVKASLIEGDTGKCIASEFYPSNEMEIIALHKGWAEQNPEIWWKNLKLATLKVLQKSRVSTNDVKAIGIAYQMHGLVLVDKDQKVLRPSIIWCDSRAVETGNKAFENIGKTKSLNHLLNSPGNFTASKLKWVKENETEIYLKTNKFMLPGDYIAMKLTGEIKTTILGLSESILWDYKNNSIAEILLDFYNIDKDKIPEIIPVFANQGQLSAQAASELGLKQGTMVSYRSGDQPNNAFSLNVLEPGELAATAGTSGVIYGVSDEIRYDPLSRVNTFTHVNHSDEQNRLGVLLCINGTGIANSWTRKMFGNKELSYDSMNKLAGKIPVGSNGLSFLPFGNGAERVLQNKEINAQMHGLNFNIHDQSNIIRAVQEGVVFSFYYGMQIMKKTGVQMKRIKAGNTNMFLSSIFTQTLANLSDTTIELYNTDGAEGAAKGAAIGYGYYKDFSEAFQNLKIVKTINPENKKQEYIDVYEKWESILNNYIK